MKHKRYTRRYYRRTMPVYEHHSRLRTWIGLILLIFLLLLIAIGGGIRSQELLSPLPKNYVQVVKEVHAVEVVQYQEPEGVEEYVRYVFGDEADNALAVFRCESGLRPDAYNPSNSNGSTDTGIAQINSIHGIREKWLKNYKINILVAKQLFDEHGHWGPWVCARKLGITN